MRFSFLSLFFIALPWMSLSQEIFSRHIVDEDLEIEITVPDHFKVFKEQSAYVFTDPTKSTATYFLEKMIYKSLDDIDTIWESDNPTLRRISEVSVLNDSTQTAFVEFAVETGTIKGYLISGVFHWMKSISIAAVAGPNTDMTELKHSAHLLLSSVKCRQKALSPKALRFMDMITNCRLYRRNSNGVVNKDVAWLDIGAGELYSKVPLRIYKYRILDNGEQIPMTHSTFMFPIEVATQSSKRILTPASGPNEVAVKSKISSKKLEYEQLEENSSAVKPKRPVYHNPNWEEAKELTFMKKEDSYYGHWIVVEGANGLIKLVLIEHSLHWTGSNIEMKGDLLFLSEEQIRVVKFEDTMIPEFDPGYQRK